MNDTVFRGSKCQKEEKKLWKTRWNTKKIS
jgi:hypothetical protein